MLNWLKEFFGIKKPNNAVETAPAAECPFKKEIPAPLPEVKAPEPEANVAPVVEPVVVEVQAEKVASKAEKPKTQQKARKPRKKKNGTSS